MGHHLVMGKLEDTLTGALLDDTHDERYRQSLLRLLINEKRYLKPDLASRHELMVGVGPYSGKLAIDILVSLEKRITMLIKYGPGSLVTRERPALAAGRLVAPYQIPVVVATNGESAHILDGATGKMTGTGLAAIPQRETLMAVRREAPFTTLDAARLEIESRLLYCYEIEGACPCDDTVCRIP